MLRAVAAGGYVLRSPPQLCSLLGICFVLFRGNGGTAANVLVALPVSNICEKSFWIFGIKMEPGLSQMGTGKGRRPWVATWETLVGGKEKLLTQEGGAGLGQGLERWWHLHPWRFSKGQGEVLSDLL